MVQLSKLQPYRIRLVKALQEDLRQRCDEGEANAPLLESGVRRPK